MTFFFCFCTILTSLLTDNSNFNNKWCSPRWLLKQEVPKIVRSINKQLREKSVKTKVPFYPIVCVILQMDYFVYACMGHRQKVENFSCWVLGFLCLLALQVGAFSVLKELVVVLPDCLADHIGALIPGIEKALYVSFVHSYLKQNSWFSWCCLQKTLIGNFHVLIIFYIYQDKSATSNLKIEALIFTRLVLASHASPVFHPYIKVLFYDSFHLVKFFNKVNHFATWTH